VILTGPGPDKTVMLPEPVEALEPVCAGQEAGKWAG
jgi:hypothetical protein